MQSETNNPSNGSRFQTWIKTNNIIQAWLVLLLALCFGSALAGVDLTLRPTIEANKINETLRQIPDLVLGPELARKMVAENQTLDIMQQNIILEKQGRLKSYSVFSARYQGEQRGWVVKIKAAGYADKIELLLGLDADMQAITGLFVLDQKETPGLGNKIAEPRWQQQFLNKKTRPPLKVVKTGATKADEIDAVTGATISSKSVTGMINAAIADLLPALERIKTQTADKES